MKFLSIIFIICINELIPHKFTHAQRKIHKRKDNQFSCADAISRIASDIAAKAEYKAHDSECSHRKYLSHKACMAKQEFAEKSVEAAQIAQSNVASKLALVNKLVEEKESVRCILNELNMSKKQLEEAINKEIEAMTSAAILQDVLDKALRLASEVAVNSDMVLYSVNNNINSMKRILQLENQQCCILCHKEHFARADVDATKAAEKEAVQAAMIARKNVLKIRGRQSLEDEFF